MIITSEIWGTACRQSQTELLNSDSDASSQATSLSSPANKDQF